MHLTYLLSKSELIDTLWNVNIQNRRIISGFSCELIDTLWNVNYADGSKQQVRKRINRYIMECKFECGRCSSVKAWELIDTLWNVNIDSCLDCGYQGEN